MEEGIELRNHKNWVARNWPMLQTDLDLDTLDLELPWLHLHGLHRVKRRRPIAPIAPVIPKKRAKKEPTEPTKLPHECQTCEATFPTYHALRYHKARACHGYPKYKCTICSRNFTTETFPDHMLTHNCDKCGQRFITNMHHLTEEAPHEFTCEVCGKRCPNRSAYRAHKDLHVGRRNATLVCRDCTDCKRWVSPVKVGENSYMKCNVSLKVPDVFVSNRTSFQNSKTKPQ